MLLTISLTLHTRHAHKALCLAMKDRRVHMIVRSVTAKGRGPKMFVLWPVRRLASSVRSDVYFTDFIVVTQHELSPPSPLSLSLPPNVLQHIKLYAATPYYCLLGAQIPYSDDYQDIDLPDFTSSSACEPVVGQQQAMDDFVRSLDLMTAAKDEDGGTPMHRLSVCLCMWLWMRV